MQIVHRFYDLFIGGAEVVVLNTIKALPNHAHMVLFSRSSKNWIRDELAQLSNVTLTQVSEGQECESVCAMDADLYCFHYYPPMSESDFRDLAPKVLARSLLLNHWYEEVPFIEGLGYIFLSDESRMRTGANIPSCRARVLLNPVADKFFRVKRTEIPRSVGRHSRDASIKFPHDFFELHESISPGSLTVLVLGSPANMKSAVVENVALLKNTYWLLDFGSVRVPSFLAMPQIYLYQTRSDFAETCPMNILEAMAAGIPVIAEDKGGIQSLIANESTGLLCRSQLDFIEACEWLLDDPSARMRLGEAGRQWAMENVSVSLFGSRLLDIADALLRI